MLSYRHAFHAGNFADVFKHVVLTLILKALRRKEKPFFYLDTHAGAGRYDLHSNRAQKNCEYDTGITRLLNADNIPEQMNDYLDAVRVINTGKNEVHGCSNVASAWSARATKSPRLRFYPGSPRIARHFLRSDDRTAFAELHPSDAVLLRKEFNGDPQTRVCDENGYQAIKELLPPAERRGLVLIDPDYELQDEFERMMNGVMEGYRRWETGIFMIWYPIMPHIKHTVLHEQMRISGIKKILLTELSVHPEDDPLQLNGSGMLIINPPWQLDSELRDLLPWLWRCLSPEGQGRWRVDWLVPES